MTLGEQPPNVGSLDIHLPPEWPPPDAPLLEIHDDYAELNCAVLDIRFPSLLPEPGIYALVRIGDLP